MATEFEGGPCGADHLLERLDQVRDAGLHHQELLCGGALERWHHLERRLDVLRARLRVARGRVTDAMVHDVEHATRQGAELLLEAARPPAGSRSPTNVDSSR
jgi:hypothetical protein